MQLDKIKNPLFIQNLSHDQLLSFADEIRQYIIEYVSSNGGYLSDNLSIVDICLSLYHTFDQDDVIVFDHTIDYAYKILNGKINELSVSNQSNMFLKAMSKAVSESMDGKDHQIVIVMNSDDFSYGDNIEILNQLCGSSIKMIIVCNDSSDNDKVGLFNRFLNSARNASSYKNLKKLVKNTIRPVKYGDIIIDNIHKAKDRIKRSIVDEGIFSTYNIDYIGPVDGHNIRNLNSAFQLARQKGVSCVVHCISKKGKGYRYAENDSSSFYSYIDRFDKKTGRRLIEENNTHKHPLTLISGRLLSSLSYNSDICVLSNDTESDHVSNLFASYPYQTFKTSISENNRTKLAIDLADQDKIPYLTVDPWILNSNEIKDLLNNIQKPMLISALLKEEETDIANSEGTDIYIPSTSEDITAIVDEFIDNNHPTVILYSDTIYEIRNLKNNNHETVLGKWFISVNNDIKDTAIFAYGKDLVVIRKMIAENGFNYSLINCNLINHPDHDLIKQISSTYKHIYFYGSLFDQLDTGHEVIINHNIRQLFDKIKGDLNA